MVGQPGMPGWATYRHWRATQQPFLEAMGPMRARRDQGLGARGRARLSRPWDPALGDRVLAAMWKGVRASELKRLDAALPSAPTLRRWRCEQPAFDAAVRGLMAQWKAKRRREAWCAELSDVIWEKIVDGGSLNSIAAEPGMPCRSTLSHWVKTQPKFAARVASACVDREYWYRDNVDDIEAEMAQGMSVAELKAIRLRSAPFRQQLGRLKNRPGRRRA